MLKKENRHSFPRFFLKITRNTLSSHGSSPPLILGGDLKTSDQNNWGGPEQKIKFGGGGGGAKFKGGGPKILGGAYEHSW